MLIRMTMNLHFYLHFDHSEAKSWNRISCHDQGFFGIEIEFYCHISMHIINPFWKYSKISNPCYLCFKRTGQVRLPPGAGISSGQPQPPESWGFRPLSQGGARICKIPASPTTVRTRDKCWGGCHGTTSTAQGWLALSMSRAQPQAQSLLRPAPDFPWRSSTNRPTHAHADWPLCTPLCVSFCHVPCSVWSKSHLPAFTPLYVGLCSYVSNTHAPPAVCKRSKATQSSLALNVSGVLPEHNLATLDGIRGRHDALR